MNEQKIAVLTDSCSDLTREMIGGAPIYVVPLKIRCPDGEFDDGVTIQAKDIYARLKMGQLPKTSLPAGESVERVLEQIYADGYEKVIAIMLSSGLSGTYNLVRLLSGSMEGKLKIKAFDSLSGAIGEGMMVLQTAREIEAGATWEELTEKRVPAIIQNTHAFFTLNTLEYLQKGGRIGKVSAMAGTLLNIKPVLGFAEDGQLTSVAKVRGRKAVSDRLIAFVREKLGDHKRFHLAVASGGAPEEMAAIRARMEQEFPGYECFWDSELDATLSVYIGDGIFGAAVCVLD